MLRRLTLMHGGSRSLFALTPSTICQSRCHSLDTFGAGYGEDHPGRSTVSILNRNTDMGLLFIDSYSNFGFRFNTGVKVIGPVALFPQSFMHWNIEDSREISPASLSLFCLTEPKFDVLVIGAGDNCNNIDHKIIRFLRERKMTVEILPTVQACSLFNELNLERRLVCAGLIPPEHVTKTDYLINTSESMWMIEREKEQFKEDLLSEEQMKSPLLKEFDQKTVVRRALGLDTDNPPDKTDQTDKTKS